MGFVVREVRRDQLSDAARLAEMWNASDEGWPGGVTGGVPITAERQLERLGQGDQLAVYVVEEDERFLGYGDLSACKGRADLAYLGLLNVRPDHHGRGCGKALILTILERATALGFAQLLLGTWAGNLKAVPLYKKTGFWWQPETSVQMRNFIPALLNMPIARPFFGRHGWYASQRRELAAAPDEVRWHGVRVYPYRFEDGDDFLAVWIDGTAEAPTAVETPDLYAACHLDREEVVCGLPQTATWEFANRRADGRPLQVTLLAEGEAGIALQVAESFAVTDRLSFERDFTVAPTLPKVAPGRPNPAVRSTVLIDGVPVKLAAGINAVQPVELEVRAPELSPGKAPERVRIKLRNRVDQPLRGEVVIEPRPGLSFDRLRTPFELPASGWSQVELRVSTDQTGALATTFRAVCPADQNLALPLAGKPLATRPKSACFPTIPLHAPYAWQDEETEEVIVETPSLRLRTRLRNGETALLDRASGRHLGLLPKPRLGPPYSWWHYAPPLLPYRLDQRDGELTLTLRIPDDHRPEVSLETALTVGGGPYLVLRHRVLNGGSAEQRLSLRSELWSNVRGALTVPLADGLIHEVLGHGDYPHGGALDLPKSPEAYAESWCAWEQDGFVTGLVWGRCAEVNSLCLQYDLPPLEPGRHADPDPLYVVAGRGNWELARRLWRWVYQPAEVREEHRPPVSPVLEAALEPAPLLLAGAATEARLVVRNRRAKAWSGRWSVAGSIMLEPGGGELAEVCRDQPGTVPVRLSSGSSAPRVETLTLTLDDGLMPHREELPVVVLGDPSGGTSVAADGERLVVANGLTDWAVSAAHAGSLVSLRRGGVEWLVSSYPEPQARYWFNPWYGGLRPYLNWDGDQRQRDEVFSAEPITRRGARELVWHGVRVRCDLVHKDLRWLRFEAEYLTLTGSNLLALVLRAVNRTAAPQGVVCGWSAWLPGAGVTVHGEADRPRYEPAGPTDDRVRTPWQRGADPYYFTSQSSRLFVMEETSRGGCLALLAPRPNGFVQATRQKDEAVGLYTHSWLELEPDETRERLSWLVLADAPSQARAYDILGRLWEVP